jgi:hypothetical protein
MDTGVARVPVNLLEYRERLHRLQSRSYTVMSTVFARARQAAAHRAQRRRAPARAAGGPYSA